MPKLTAMMIVRNEADRYLVRCLRALVNYVDEIIILDDGSTDETPEVCLSFPTVRLYRQNDSTFLVDESQLRQKLWQYTTDSKPEWILAIDADEFIEPNPINELTYLFKQDHFNAISFRLFDCWGSEDDYRVDGLWNPWLRGFSIYIVKYQPKLSSDWPSLKFHCGRIPLAYRHIPHYESNLKIKHLGWANSANIAAKYVRAVSQDPTYQYIIREHYESILWPLEKVALEKWQELSIY